MKTLERLIVFVVLSVMLIALSILTAEKSENLSYFLSSLVALTAVKSIEITFEIVKEIRES